MSDVRIRSIEDMVNVDFDDVEIDGVERGRKWVAETFAIWRTNDAGAVRVLDNLTLRDAIDQYIEIWCDSWAAMRSEDDSE